MLLLLFIIKSCQLFSVYFNHFRQRTEVSSFKINSPALRPTIAGASLAALPVLTVRLDPAAGVWDLYVFQRLVAEDIPLVENKGARQFTLTSGAQGAMVLNLTLSDESPLFVDANHNGIDDAFEKQKRNGSLLAANAPAAERKALAAEWKAAQTVAKPVPWKIRRPVPDEAVAAVTPR